MIESLKLTKEGMERRGGGGGGGCGMQKGGLGQNRESYYGLGHLLPIYWLRKVLSPF
jgi:hypothetical protein